jgi:hypothetical protein
MAKEARQADNRRVAKEVEQKRLHRFERIRPA